MLVTEAVAHPALIETAAALERAGVNWLLLRPPDNSAAPQGDVDLLVSAEDLGRCRAALWALDYAPVPVAGYGSHYLRYDRPTDQWLWLHIVTEIAFGPYYALTTGADASCLARRDQWRGLPVLAPADLFWVTVLHCLLDKGAIAERHRDALRALAVETSDGGPLRAVVAPLLPPGWTPDRLGEAAIAGDWAALEGLAAGLLAAWRRRQRLGKARMLACRVGELATQARLVWRRRGVRVALLGPDGAGKSTLAEGLARSFIFPSRRIYMGLTGELLPSVERLRLVPLVIAGRLAIFWGRYLSGRYHQARGRLVIFDRYIYDAAVPPAEPLTRFGWARRWLDGHACPGPDMTVLLNAPGHVMHARKGEYDSETLEAWRVTFLAVRRVPGLEVVDTTRDRDEVRRDVTERVWRRYASRWRGEG